MQKPAILIVEENAVFCRHIKKLLLRHGFAVTDAGDSTHILQSLRHKRLDLIIIGSAQDSNGNAVEVAQQIRRWNTRIPLILITAHSSEELAIAALRAGINDYFKHPVVCAELVASIHRCLANSLPQQSSAKYETAVSDLMNEQGMIGESPPIQEIKTYIGKVASTDSNVLITGETGTGKELVAELIHRNSPRYQRALICINCAAIPDSLLESELFGYERGAFTGANAFKEGKLAQADGGTIFFDEIGDMNSYAQAKILRAIESKEIQRLGGKENIPLNLRIVTATNQDLEWLMSTEKFRQDLYFRLNVARIHLPPLRERKEDIPLLLNYYIRELNCQFRREVEGFTGEAFDYLLHYDWPGNVRELKNLVEAIFVNLPSRRISFMDLPEPFRRRLRNTQALPPDERDRVLSALFSTNWNMSKAAQKLHWSRMTLYRKMAKYHIVREGKTENSTPTSSKSAVTSSP